MAPGLFMLAAGGSFAVFFGVRGLARAAPETLLPALSAGHGGGPFLCASPLLTAWPSARPTTSAAPAFPIPVHAFGLALWPNSRSRCRWRAPILGRLLWRPPGGAAFPARPRGRGVTLPSSWRAQGRRLALHGLARGWPRGGRGLSRLGFGFALSLGPAHPFRGADGARGPAHPGEPFLARSPCSWGRGAAVTPGEGMAALRRTPSPRGACGPWPRAGSCSASTGALDLGQSGPAVDMRRGLAAWPLARCWRGLADGRDPVKASCSRSFVRCLPPSWPGPSRGFAGTGCCAWPLSLHLGLRIQRLRPGAPRLAICSRSLSTVRILVVKTGHAPLRLPVVSSCCGGRVLAPGPLPRRHLRRTPSALGGRGHFPSSLFPTVGRPPAAPLRGSMAGGRGAARCCALLSHRALLVAAPFVFLAWLPFSCSARGSGHHLPLALLGAAAVYAMLVSSASGLLERREPDLVERRLGRSERPAAPFAFCARLVGPPPCSPVVGRRVVRGASALRLLHGVPAPR